MTSRASKEKTEDTDNSVETVELYNVNDGPFGRDGGPYLDQVQERIAEQNRAFVEKREPDYENVPPSVGTQLVTPHQLIQGFNNNALAGQEKLNFTGGIEAPVRAEAEVPVLEEDNSPALLGARPENVEVVTQAPPDDKELGDLFPTGKEEQKQEEKK